MLDKMLYRLQESVHFFKRVIVRHAPTHVLPDILLSVQFRRVVAST
jgi:hypothetical protein